MASDVSEVLSILVIMNLERIYQSKSQFVAREVGNELVLVPLAGSVAQMKELFTMNETGRFIWENITECVSVDILVEQLVNEFDVDDAIARRDIESFLMRLEQIM